MGKHNPDLAEAIHRVAMIWLSHRRSAGTAKDCVQAVSKASQFLRDRYMQGDEPGFLASAERDALLRLLQTYGPEAV